MVLHAAHGHAGRRRDGIVGRDAELAAVAALVAAPDVRLVTVTGLAGVGKTRLVLELAARPPEPVIHVVVVELAAIEDPALVGDALVRSLPGPHGLATGPAGSLWEHLGGSAVLLVLDNVEQIPGIAGVVESVLEAYPAATVVATSLSPLHVRGEQVVRLGPLPVLAKDEPVDLDADPALALFVARAEAADHSFVLDAASAAGIREVCRETGGLPLAIELAAARVASVPPTMMARQIRSVGPDVLRAAEVGLPSRHHGMAAALGWTCAMLSSDAADLLVRLSVFESPFVVESAQEVCRPEVRGLVLLDLLSELVDMHLLDPSQVEDAPRYAMPRLVRSYARAQLQELGLAEQTRAAHAALFRAKVQRDGQRRTSEWPDVVAALDHSTRTGLVSAALQSAVASSAALDHSPGAASTLLPLLETLLQSDARLDPATHARALLWSTLHSPRDADGAVAFGLWTSQRLGEAVALARESGDDAALLDALELTVMSIPITLDVEAGMAAALESLEVARRVGDEAALARCEIWSAMVRLQTGDVQRALGLALSGYARAHAAGDDTALVFASLLLHRVPAQARPPLDPDLLGLEDLLALCRDRSMPKPAGLVMALLSQERTRSGDYGGAAWLLAEQLSLAGDLESTEPLASVAPLALLIVLATAAQEWTTAGVLRARLLAVEPHLPRILPPDVLGDYLAACSALEAELGEDGWAALRAETPPTSMPEANRSAQAVARSLAARRSGPSQVPTPRPGPAELPSVPGERPLTARELEVLQELVGGLTNREIAERLGMSMKTAMHHTTAIYRKLGVRGRAEAVALAVRRDLVPRA